MEVTARRRLTQRIEIEPRPRLREGGAGAGLSDPTGESDTRRMRLVELELLDRPRAAHDFPRVRRAFRRVNEDRARCTLASCFLQLVCPAAVVRENLAEKQRGIDEARIVHEHQ